MRNKRKAGKSREAKKHGKAEKQRSWEPEIHKKTNCVFFFEISLKKYHFLCIGTLQGPGIQG